MNPVDIPATLGEAILTEPLWLQAWIVILSSAVLGSVLFLIRRDHAGWHLRRECFAILVSAVAAALIMDWLYAEYGYVRLLGLGHLIAWTPAYVFVWLRRRRIGYHTWFGRYIHFYLIIAGLSLCIDAIDVLRYVLGDGELYLRWAEPA